MNDGNEGAKGGEEARASGETARSAGRGGIAIAGAKVYFMLTGLVQQIALKWVLGLDAYGDLRSAQSIASVTYNPINSTSILGVSRPVAGASDAERPAVIRSVLTIHASIALIAGVGFFLLTETLGAAVNAPHLVGALRILSIVVLAYGLYTPLVGVMNGTQRFLHQAGVDAIMATLRTGGLIAGAWLFTRRYGAGVEGAMSGFAIGAIVILFVALAMVGIGRRGGAGLKVTEHLAFIAPLLLGQVLLNLLMQADLTLLRRFAADAATAASQPPEAASPLVGAYAATQLFGFLPYQLLLSVTFILFPLLAKAHKSGDREAVAQYVRRGVRLAVVLAGLMVSVTSGLSAGLLNLVFGADAAGLGARSMQLLTVGLGAFAIFGILTTVLNSLERERTAMAITGAAFALVAASCFTFVRGRPFGPDLLWATAASTTAGLVGGTLIAAYFVHRTAGAVVGLASLARVAAATAAAIAIARHLPGGGKVLTLAYSALVGVAYLVALVASRELTGADLDDALAIVRRRRS